MAALDDAQNAVVRARLRLDRAYADAHAAVIEAEQALASAS